MGAMANHEKVDAFAATLVPLMAELRERGLSLRQMAAELPTQGMPTPTWREVVRSGRADAAAAFGGVQRAILTTPAQP
jgi:hypothetical protein